MSFEEEIPPTIQLEGIIHRHSRGIFVPVFDGEEEDEEDKELFYCFSCENVGIESVLSKRISFATTDKKGNTILKQEADIPGLDEGKEYRQCHRCGDIYALGDLKRQRRSEELEEQERDERDHNWRPPELTKSLHKKSRRNQQRKNLLNLKKSSDRSAPVGANSRTKEPEPKKLVKGKIRQIKRVKFTKRS